MKSINKFSIALKNFIKSSNFKFSIFLTTLIITALLFSISFNQSLNTYWKDTVRKTMDYRTLLVAYNPSKMEKKEALESLKKYNNVEKVVEYDAYLITMRANDYIDRKKENSFFLVGSIDNPVQIEKGNDLSKYENDDNVMICAKQFYPYFESNEEDYVLKNSINLSNRVGEDMSISFIGSEQAEKFKLVGVYDAKKTNAMGNTCYTKWGTVSKLNLKYQREVYEPEEGEYLPLVVVLNDVENVDEFEKTIINDGFATTGPVVKVNTVIGNSILNKIILITIFIFILINIISLTNSLRNMEEHKAKYILMKVFGFSYKDIYGICFYEELIKYTISFVTAIPLCMILNYIFEKSFLKNQVFLNGLFLKISTVSLFLTFIVSIFISVITSKITSKYIRKFDVIKILRG